MQGKATGDIVRCPWAPEHIEIYTRYHDEEWGVPVHDDRTLFETLILDGAQAGLSWLTILQKREAYRRAFDGFDMQTVAAYGESDVQRLMADPGIVRNRQKITAAILNARVCLELAREYGSLSACLWQFTGGRTIVNAWERVEDLPARTPESEAMSRFLAGRGMKFVGPTICYAFMQGTGMVNDHVVSCFRYAQLARSVR